MSATQSKPRIAYVSARDPSEVNRTYSFAIQNVVDDIDLKRQEQQVVLALWTHALRLWKEWESAIFYGGEKPPSDTAIEQHAVLVTNLIAIANQLLTNFRGNDKLGDKDDVQRTCEIISGFKRELEASVELGKSSS